MNDIDIPTPKEYYIIGHGDWKNRSYFLVQGKEEALEKTQTLKNVSIYFCAKLEKVYPLGGLMGQ